MEIKNTYINDLSQEIINTLLTDRTTKKNLIWAADDYKKRGYAAQDYIPVECVCGHRNIVIKPRVEKSKAEIQKRIRNKAEVFTPSWICNAQNNLVDNAWFGIRFAFNIEGEKSWITNTTKVSFSDIEGKSWQDYVKQTQLEVSCGEAPYLVSRYDSVSGEFIKTENRIGLLDRKMRVINENAATDEEWLEWVQNAYKSVYGYDFQGDNVVIARENLLYTFIDNYINRFDEMPDEDILAEIAKIISWNIWQMDGLKGVVPNSCKTIKTVQMTFFGENIIEEKCEGCEKYDIARHNGTYCVVKDWEKNKNIPFITLMGYKSLKAR